MKKSKVLTSIVSAIIVILGIVVIATIFNKPPVTTQTPTANSGQPTSSRDTSGTTKVTISDFAFTPSSVTAKVGTAVTWTNKDSVAHTIITDTSTVDGPNSDSVAAGGHYTFTFKKAGTYTYHCSIHPKMTGTVIVN